jgi:UDP-glucose 4-epimerase
MDLASGHIAALNKAKELKGFNVYNLGTGNGTSVMELVKSFEKVNGITLPIVLSERRAGDVEALKACVEKANSDLNWKAELSIDDMCRDAYRWVKQNPNGY